MKDVVELSARGQIKAHRDNVDELGDAVWLKEARLELPFGRLGQEGDSMMVLAEQDPIANRVGDRAVKLVVVALLDRLGLFQPIADVCEELVVVRHVLGDSNHTRLAPAHRSEWSAGHGHIPHGMACRGVKSGRTYCRCTWPWTASRAIGGGGRR